MTELDWLLVGFPLLGLGLIAIGGWLFSGGRKPPDYTDAVQKCIADTEKYIVNWIEEE